METLGQFNPIGTDVLDRRCTHLTRDQREIFKSRLALFDQSRDGCVPVLTGAELGAPAADIDLQHQAIEVARQQ